jgi:hypothetical protein
MKIKRKQTWKQMEGNRGDQLRKALTIIDLLQRKEGVTYRVIATHCEVSIKTAKRWMRAAEHALALEIDEPDYPYQETFFRLNRRFNRDQERAKTPRAPHQARSDYQDY